MQDDVSDYASDYSREVPGPALLARQLHAEVLSFKASAKAALVEPVDPSLQVCFFWYSLKFLRKL